MTLRKCIWRGGQFILPLLFPQTFFINISSYILDSIYLKMFTSLLYHRAFSPREGPCLTGCGLASAHCDTLRQSPSEAGVWSPEPEPRPGPVPPRGQSRYNDLLWLSLQSTFTTQSVPTKRIFSPVPQLFFRDFFIRTPCPKERRGLGKTEKI